MFRSYEEYLEYKNNKFKEFEDERRIGERYLVWYSELKPSNREQYEEFKKEKEEEEKKSFDHEYYDINKCFLGKLTNTKTILEYVGNGIYKDLLSGYYIRNSISDNKEECIDCPFYWDDTERNITVDSIESLESIEYERIICQELENKVHVLLNDLYDSLLNDEMISDNKKEEIKKKKEEFDQKRIGNKYVVKWDSLKSTIDSDYGNYAIQSDYSLALRPIVLYYNYTIVEYLGDSLYKDLTTGDIYTDKEITIEFEKDGERVDYSEINFEDYLHAVNYPIRIPKNSKEVIEDYHLLNIYRSDIQSRKEKISKCYEDVCNSLRKHYKNELRDMYSDEYKKQYLEAEDEYREFLEERQKQHDIEEAKKIYKLNI